jgi:hypothetical protein
MMGRIVVTEFISLDGVVEVTYEGLAVAWPEAGFAKAEKAGNGISLLRFEPQRTTK